MRGQPAVDKGQFRGRQSYGRLAAGIAVRPPTIHGQAVRPPTIHGQPAASRHRTRHIPGEWPPSRRQRHLQLMARPPSTVSNISSLPVKDSLLAIDGPATRRDREDWSRRRDAHRPELPPHPCPPARHHTTSTATPPPIQAKLSYSSSLRAPELAAPSCTRARHGPILGNVSMALIYISLAIGATGTTTGTTTGAGPDQPHPVGSRPARPPAES